MNIVVAHGYKLPAIGVRRMIICVRVRIFTYVPSAGRRAGSVRHDAKLNSKLPGRRVDDQLIGVLRTTESANHLL